VNLAGISIANDRYKLDDDQDEYREEEHEKEQKIARVQAQKSSS
jgi:hypothetical protein